MPDTKTTIYRIILFIWNSREDNLQLEKTNQWLPRAGVGGQVNWEKGTIVSFGDDWNILYCNYNIDHTVIIDICQNSTELYTLNGCVLLYVNYTSKLIFKKIF